MKKSVPLEDGIIRKVWGDKLRICLAYPNNYRIGMSNLGFQTVYRLFNDHPQVLCERIFLPSPKERVGKPISIESGRPVQDFHILAFSISFENDYLGVLKLLSWAGIEIEREKRMESAPLVIAGGVAVTLNPEPLAKFIDLFLIGEGEVMIPLFLETCLAGYEAGIKKKDLLEKIQRELPSAYVPAFYEVAYDSDGRIEEFRPLMEGVPEKIKRDWVKDIDSMPCEQVIITPEAELGNMYLVEVNRGCARGCRFCAAGYVYRPVRFRRGASITSCIRRGVEKTKRVGLLGTAVSDHPELLKFCQDIIERGGEVAIGSLRLDRLTTELVEMLVLGGVKTVAIAPEAGSQRMRNLINKQVEEYHIWEALSLLLEKGIENLRIYFMIGLPTEKEDDIDALIQLTKEVAAYSVKVNGREAKFRSITVSINPFIPKPVTPFQWEPLASGRYLQSQIKRIKNALARIPLLDIRATSYRESYIQALFSLGDRRVGEILKYRLQGMSWSQAFSLSKPHPNFWVHRRKELKENLPWDFIDHGVKKETLLKEYFQISVDK
ncbi:MAG: radical SAM protein [Syntrophales bacterium]|nr:radical SAM protein [Syntrophales bacterium]